MAAATAAAPSPPRPFRPASQYPIDPHLGLHTSNSNPNLREEFHRRLPWTLNVNHLPDQRQPRRDVILILGDPHPTALQPLLTSPFFHECLIIFATNSASLNLSPPSSKPTVSVLRTDPKFRDGAEQLVNVLQNAEQIAREWRALHYNDESNVLSMVDLAESVVSHNSTPEPKRRPFGINTSSRRNSKIIPSSPPSIVPSRSFDAILNFLPQHMNNKLLLKHAILVTTMTAPYITTSSSFVANTTSTARKRKGSKSSTLKGDNSGDRRWTSPPSTFRSFNLKSTPNLHTHTSSLSTSSLLPRSRPTSIASTLQVLPSPVDPPKVIHILPLSAAASASSAIQHLQVPKHPSRPGSASSFGHAHLIRSMEAFLLSYAYGPLQQMQRTQNPMMNSGPAANAPPFNVRPFILDRASLSNILRINKKEWTLAEIILGGALDANGDAEFAPEGMTDLSHTGSTEGSSTAASSPLAERPISMSFGHNTNLAIMADKNSAWMAKRAWLANVNDLVLLPKPDQRLDANHPPYAYAFNQPPIQIPAPSQSNPHHHRSPKRHPTTPTRTGSHSRQNSGSKSALATTPPMFPTVASPPSAAAIAIAEAGGGGGGSGYFGSPPPRASRSENGHDRPRLASLRSTDNNSGLGNWGDIVRALDTPPSPVSFTSRSSTPPARPPRAVIPPNMPKKSAMSKVAENKSLPTPPDSGSSTSDESQIENELGGILGGGVLHESPENIEQGLTPPSGFDSGARFFGKGGSGSGTPSATTSWDSLSDQGVARTARQSGMATPASRNGDSPKLGGGGDFEKRKWSLKDKFKFGKGGHRYDGGEYASSEHGFATPKKEIMGGSLGRHVGQKKWWTFW